MWELIINENLRKYSSSIIADQLHYDRNHIDRQISLWYSFNHGDKNKSKFISANIGNLIRYFEKIILYFAS